MKRRRQVPGLRIILPFLLLWPVWSCASSPKPEGETEVIQAETKDEGDDIAMGDEENGQTNPSTSETGNSANNADAANGSNAANPVVPANSGGEAAVANSAAAIPPQVSTGGLVQGDAGTSAANGLPEFGSKMPYIVKSGDTLAKIAKEVYGNYKQWHKLADLSSIPNPNLIYPGDVVYYQLTKETLKFATKYENQPTKVVVVAKGDTLANLAVRIYGSKDLWKVLWRHNGQVKNPDQLQLGTIIYAVHANSVTMHSNHGAQGLKQLGYKSTKTNAYARI